MNGTRLRAVTGRLRRGYADARRIAARSGSASPALDVVGKDRRDVLRWTEQLARRHEAHRAAIEPARGRVAVVCVSSRPHFLTSVVDSVARQDYADVELVFVTNSAAYADVDVEAALTPLDDVGIAVAVLRRDPDASLGSCLNAAMAVTEARFVAKFDDDDRYGRHYLADALRAHAYAGAGIVGKHTYYAHLVDTDRSLLRFPGNEFRYSSTLAGGTLVLDRDRTGDLAFPDLSLGEDRGLIARCHRAGVSTFSSDRFNFLQGRAGDNTWQITHTDFAAQSIDLGPGDSWSDI